MSTAPTSPRLAPEQVRMQLPQRPSHHLDFSCVEERKENLSDGVVVVEQSRCRAKPNAMQPSGSEHPRLYITSGTTTEEYRALCSPSEHLDAMSTFRSSCRASRSLLSSSVQRPAVQKCRFEVQTAMRRGLSSDAQQKVSSGEGHCFYMDYY